MKDKELNIMKSISCIFLVLGLVFSTIYNGNNETTSIVINFLSKPIVYPILLFVLGSRINIKNYNEKQLLKYSLYLFIISILFNIFIYFIPNIINNNPFYYTLFTVNIFMFMSFTFLFFYIIKKINIKEHTLWGIALLFSVLNTFLTVYLKDNVSTNIFIAYLKDILFSYSINSYFSFLGWIIFPITGYLYAIVIDKKTDTFRFLVGLISLILYISLLTLSFKFYNGDLFVFEEESELFSMDIYSSLMNITLCLFIYSFSYFISKIIPSKINKICKIVGTNNYVIYIISYLIINYLFIAYGKNLYKFNFIEYSFIYIILFIITSYISKLITKYTENF